ncbi:hypothetical protein JI435_411780 [Parastagonospora nodorum SN15]|uniref:Uncharacterized protein n=1 Tax=Phaeosphaeria nodorum (strain SN15 / ATCC MYA-4574 / FGSC 10173) TaxID=321614 RepID=A0A7U2F8B0_PHANO|nr:hypothetical protein JI435_411780 [Parastagonospora nodorum SN15]
MVSGASRLRRRPVLSACSKRFASSRPWSASASSGDSAGGTSPRAGWGGRRATGCSCWSWPGSQRRCCSGEARRSASARGRRGGQGGLPW